MGSGKKFTFYFLTIATLILAISYSVKAADSNPPEPTVEGCVEKTGLSEEKCEKMIEKMKNRKPGDRERMTKGGPKDPNESKEVSENTIERELRMAEKMKEWKENKFSKTETVIEKIIEFLKSKGIDTNTIEENLETLKNKYSAILDVVDDYISILEELESSDATELSDEAKEIKEKIKDLMDNLRDFYKNTLRDNIKTQVDKLYE